MIDTMSRNESCCQASKARGAAAIVAYKPRFDVWEDDNEVTLLGDLPGVLPEDLEIRYQDQQLTISGKVPPRHEQGMLRLSEYGVGDFQRSFTLADTIDPDQISADLKNGVLTLHLPKKEEVKSRRITVQA